MVSMSIQVKLIAIFSLLILIEGKSVSGFEAEHLKFEYLVNPIGIDALNSPLPRICNLCSYKAIFETMFGTGV